MSEIQTREGITMSGGDTSRSALKGWEGSEPMCNGRKERVVASMIVAAVVLIAVG